MRSDPPPPNPVRTVINRLGGQNTVARLLDLRQSTVWNWCDRGEIPYGRMTQLIEAARRLDPPVALEAGDFFLPPAEAA